METFIVAARFIKLNHFHISQHTLRTETRYLGPRFKFYHPLFGLNQTDLKVGDEIAAYDGDICVGATKLTSKDLSKNAASIIASASDADKVNGFIENNDIVLKYWSDASKSEIDLSISVLDGSLMYNKYGSMFAMLNKQMPGIDDNGLKSLEIDMYPNPAINNVTISFSASNMASSIFTSITCAPSSTCARAIESASSYFSSLISRKNFLDPATFVLSPILTKFISGITLRA